MLWRGRSSFLLLSLLLCLPALAVLGARPLLLTWGRTTFANSDTTVSNPARRVANLSVDIVDGVIGDSSLKSNDLFSHLTLVDKQGRVYMPPVYAADIPPYLIRYFTWRAVTGVVADQPFEPFLASGLDPVVKVAGHGTTFLLTNQNDVFVINGTYELEPLQNNTIPGVVPPAAVKFIDIVCQDDSVGLISTSGTAYVLSPDACTTGTTLPAVGGQGPLLFPSSKNVTMMDVRFQHGVAIVDDNPTQSVWAWGDENFAGIGGSLTHACTTPVLVPGMGSVMGPTDRVKFAVAGPVETHLVLQSGRVISFGVRPPYFDSEIEAISIDARLQIEQLIPSYAGLHVLLSDGTVWSRVLLESVLYAQNGVAALTDFSNRNNVSTRTLWQAKFTPALPADYKIRKLIATSLPSSELFAIADPITSGTPVQEPPINLPNPYETTPATSRLITWGGCLFSPHITSSEDVPTPPYFTSRDHLMDLRHLPKLPPEANQVAKVAMSELRALILTASGHVLSWGTFNDQTPDAGASPYQRKVAWRLPKPIDEVLFGALPVLDVAVSFTSSAVVLNNGSLLIWGGLAFPTGSYKRDASVEQVELESDPKTFGEVSRQSKRFPMFDKRTNMKKRNLEENAAAENSSPPVNLASLAYTKLYQGNFHQVRGFKNIFVALNQATMRAVNIGFAQGELPDDFPLVEHDFLTGQEVPRLVFPAINGFVMVTNQQRVFIGRMGSNITDLDCDSWLTGNPAGIPFYYCLLPPTSVSQPLNPSLILDVVAGESFVIFRAADGLYGLGVCPGVWGPYYALPQLLSFPGVDPALLTNATLAKVTISSAVHFLLVNGTVLSNCGDYFSMCTHSPNVYPILQDSYEFTDIMSSGAVESTCMMAVVNLRPQIPAVEPAYKALFLGDGYSGAAGFGYYGYSGQIETFGLAPPGHPLESATVRNLSVGVYTSMVDGIREDVPVPTDRWMRWGAFSVERSQLDIGNTPVFVNFNYSNAAAMVSASAYHIVIHRDCVIDLWLPNASSIVGFPPQPIYSSQPNTRVSRDSSIGWNSLLDWKVSPCDARGSTIVDFKCHSKSAGGADPIFCLVWTSDDHLYVWSLETTPSIANLVCQTGLLGDPATCATGYVGGNYTYDVDVSSSLSSLLGKSVKQTALGARHALVLTTTGEVVCWGDTKYGQCGAVSRGAVPAVTTPTRIFLPVDAPVTNIVASSWNSYAVISDLYIYAWGDNKYGGLGTGLDATQAAFSTAPVIVRAPVRPITQFTCSSYSCYILYGNAELYTWGMGDMNQLGRPIPVLSPQVNDIPWYDARPALATSVMSTFGINRRITEIHTSSAAAAAILRAVYSPSTSAPVAIGCIGSPPSPQFDCVDGSWVAAGHVVIGPSQNNTQVVISSPTVVIGNVTVEPGSVIVFSNPSSGGPLLNVSGCFTGTPTIQIQLDPQTWKITKQGKPGNKQIPLIESACEIDSSSIANPKVTTPKDCRRTSATLKDGTSATGRPTLNALMTINSSKCNIWWIVVLSLLGAATIAVVIGAIIWTKIRNKHMKPAI